MTETQPFRGRAVVTLTLEVSTYSHWSNSATIPQVVEQGGRETVQAILDALHKTMEAKVVGKPKVGFMIWNDYK